MTKKLPLIVVCVFYICLFFEPFFARDSFAWLSVRTAIVALATHIATTYLILSDSLDSYKCLFSAFIRDKIE